MGNLATPRKVLAGEVVISSAGTAGSVVFSNEIDALHVYSPLACWVSVANNLGTAAPGTLADSRRYCPANVERVIPWTGSIVYAVNYAAAATGTIVCEGWIL